MKVQIILEIDLVDVCADADEGSGRWIEDDEPVVPLAGRHVPFVAQTEFQHQVCSRFVIVLDKESQYSLSDAARLTAQCHAERVCDAGNKGVYRGEIKRAGALTEIVVQKLPVFSPELQRMRAIKPTKRVSHDKSGIAPTRRLCCWTSKIQVPAGDANLWQADRLSDTVTNAEICGIELRIRRRTGREPTNAGAQFVDDVGTEGMRFAQCEDLSQSAAGVTKPGDGVTSPAWFSGLRPFNGVISM